MCRRRLHCAFAICDVQMKTFWLKRQKMAVFGVRTYSQDALNRECARSFWSSTNISAVSHVIVTGQSILRLLILLSLLKFEYKIENMFSDVSIIQRSQENLSSAKSSLFFLKPMCSPVPLVDQQRSQGERSPRSPRNPRKFAKDG